MRLLTRIWFFLSFLVLFFVMGCDNTDNHPVSISSPSPPASLSFVSPARITSFDEDSLLISDYESNYLYLMDKTTLEVKSKIKVSGKSTGVAVDDGKIFVGNRTLRSVDVFDGQGNFLYRLGSGKAQFQQINDVAVDSVNNLVYALDTKGKCFKRFYYTGESAGSDIGVGILEHPTAVAVDMNGNILISDFGVPSSPQIRRFTPAGATLTSILGSSTTFSSPQGLDVDSGNYLYLVDTHSATVRVYNLASLSFVKNFGARGTGPGELFHPLDVVIDNVSKDVFVTDNGNVRIAAFQGEGVTP